MKRIVVMALCGSLLFSMPVLADVNSDIAAAEKTFGIDNSDKTAIERITALEKEIGITSKKGETLAERLKAIDEQLGISDNTSETEAETSAEASTEKAEKEDSEEGNDLVTAPTDDFVMERLKLVQTITDMAAVTEDHDPNGQLNKPGGYIGCIYFTDKQVDRDKNYITSDDVIEVGTVGGGAIEIFANSDDAKKREEYLATYDGTAMSSGSHKVIGTCLIRTSDYLTASQQQELTQNIITALTATDTSTVSMNYSIAPEELDKDNVNVQQEYELYNQDGYVVSCLGYKKDAPDALDGDVLKLRVQNLTHRNIAVSSRDSYVNGQMIQLGLYFEIASGKTQTQDVYLYGTDLKNAGVDSVSDITLNLDVVDQESFSQLTTIGPLTLKINDDGSIDWKKVYTDKETIKEVQTLLNEKGYDCGTPDGVAGKKTNNMILQYERDKGLEENTDITDELIASLRG